ncbi:unnamed protein product [Aphanomyces euteiches]|uniref:Uncharacterized protein n=1 Tax=Aphanomyces euteiches TaxID=100861 RepID=A0A6G0X9J7_9STRA|nr:hypothetical protein Ae201684_007145 [Aphanomyces euteiches]KAH9052516.1 hypothetical protein Ae201684P_001696 [Aphanomyces euteiches]KAH9138612.1 hypothetical protein AeRB84_017071 [Aphanomyces euteiches]
MPLEKLPWAPFYIMATVGGAAAFFLDLLVSYLTFNFSARHWLFIFVGTFVMACIDETTKYIAYISSVRREMKEVLTRECICWLMARTASGYAVWIGVVLICFAALYGIDDKLPVVLSLFALDIVNNISCSTITGVWLFVRKHHKHATHHTVPTQLEDCCKDSVIGPAIFLRFLFYIAAFSFVFLNDMSTFEVILYIAINVAYAILVAVLVVLNVRFLKPNNVHTDASTVKEIYDRTGVEDGVVIFPDGSRA